MFASNVPRSGSVRSSQLKRATRLGHSRPITAATQQQRETREIPTQQSVLNEISSSDEDDITPGPGYYASETLTAFLPKQIPEKF